MYICIYVYIDVSVVALIPALILDANASCGRASVRRLERAKRACSLQTVLGGVQAWPTWAAICLLRQAIALCGVGGLAAVGDDMAGLGGDVTAPGDDLAALGADRYALVWRRSYSGRRPAALLVRTTAPHGAPTTEDCLTQAWLFLRWRCHVRP